MKVSSISTSPEMFKASRLVARILMLLTDFNNLSTISAHACTKCSQLSSRIRSDLFFILSISVSMIGLSGSSLMFNTSVIDFAMKSGFVIGEKSTNHTPSLYSSIRVKAISLASLVFPHPPAPVRVIRRLLKEIPDFLHLFFSANKTGCGNRKVMYFYLRRFILPCRSSISACVFLFVSSSDNRRFHTLE